MPDYGLPLPGDRDLEAGHFDNRYRNTHHVAPDPHPDTETTGDDN